MYSNQNADSLSIGALGIRLIEIWIKMLKKIKEIYFEMSSAKIDGVHSI